LWQKGAYDKYYEYFFLNIIRDGSNEELDNLNVRVFPNNKGLVRVNLPASTVT